MAYFSATGRNGFSYDGRTTGQLLAGLSSWSPTVRKRSAQTLGQREGDFVAQLLKLLGGADRYGRYGACEALGCLGQRADTTAPQLRVLLKDPDPWMESLACNAIARLGPAARKAAASDLLALATRKNAADPRGMSQRAVANALFEPYPGSGGPRGILADSLSEVDRRLLYPAIQSVLENDDGAARLTLARYYGVHVRHRLTPGGVTKLKAEGEPIGCRWWCDAYELRQTDRRVLAAYAGGPLDGLAAVVECPIGKGRVILLGTQPDDAWLRKLIGRLAPGAKSDPGVMVTERVTADGKPAGAIIVNTRRDAASYRTDSEANILAGYAVEFVNGR